MISWIVRSAKELLSGGASYIILGIAGVLVFQHWQIGRVTSQRDALRIERDNAHQAIAQKDSLIETQSRQFNRRAQFQKEQDHAESYIQTLPVSQDCIMSEPVSGALEWLREHKARKPGSDAD